ncbi:MAG: OmpA family protein [Planctomycetota bacterium]
MFQPHRFVRSRLAGALLAAAAVTACATPQEVNYTRQVAKEYETRALDLERQLAEKNAELDQLKVRYAREKQAQPAVIPASMGRRIDELAGMIDSLDEPMGDVHRFEMEGGYLLMIQDRILFDSGSAELGSEGTSALSKIAAEIAAAPHGSILVRGHTDSDPVKKPETLKRFPHGNLQLSAERAVSVATYLIGNSRIAGGDVVVMGFGSWKPLRENDSAESKRLNRRVEIFVSDPDA